MEIYVKAGDQELIRLGGLGYKSFVFRQKCLQVLIHARKELTTREISKRAFNLSFREQTVESDVSAALKYLEERGLTRRNRNDSTRPRWSITQSGREAWKSLRAQERQGWPAKRVRPPVMRGHADIDRVAVWANRENIGRFDLFVELRRHLVGTTRSEQDRVELAVASVAGKLHGKGLAQIQGIGWSSLRFELCWRDDRIPQTAMSRGGLLVAHDIAALLEDKLNFDKQT